jgi:ATP-dependent DNA ligase
MATGFTVNRRAVAPPFLGFAQIDPAGKARLWFRNHLPLEPKFPTIQDAVDELKVRSTILESAIVALDRDGIPRFQLRRQWQKRPTAPVVLYLFDLLWSDGRDITEKTVLQRRDRLEQVINPVPGIQVAVRRRNGKNRTLSSRG